MALYGALTHARSTRHLGEGQVGLFHILQASANRLKDEIGCRVALSGAVGKGGSCVHRRYPVMMTAMLSSRFMG
jgi:hypothetical protein